MITYPKIDTPFKRAEDGTKKLIQGAYKSETVEFIANNEWVWTEKVDGTNTQVAWDGHSVTYGGRTQASNIQVTLLNYLVKTFGTNDVEELFEQKFGEMPVVLFGEGYGAKIQKSGGLYRADNALILFDVYLPNQKAWMRRDSVEDIAKAFGLEVVPIALTGTIEDAIEYIQSKPMSLVNPAHKMEGVVGRPKVELIDRMGRRVITKIKAHDFTEGWYTSN